MVRSFAIALSLLLIVASPVFADGQITPLPWNMKADQSVCSRIHHAVWSVYRGGQDCIRYFPAGSLDKADTAIVVMRGDRVDWVKRNPKKIPDNTEQAQQKQAERLQKVMDTPVVLLERPGTFGSSGNHLRRRQQEEFLALNAALDAIQRRYNIKRLVLLGHSGGATAAAALLTLGRTDVACAVLTSGAYGLVERAHMLGAQAGRIPKPGRDTTGLPSPYDPLEHIGEIVHDPKRIVFVIGDPRDRVTPFSLQRRFAETLRANGHSVRLVTHDARAPRFHNLLGDVGLRTASRCAREQVR